MLLQELSPDRGRRRANGVAQAAFMTGALVTVLVSLLIVWTLGSEAWSFVSQVRPESLSEIGWYPRRGLFDLSTLFVGTALIAGVAMVVSVPLGVGVALYLAEFAQAGVRRVLKPAIEMLASVPSVVLGFFAISFITPDLLSRLFVDIRFFNMLAAGIAVGILTTPLIASIAEDSLRAVPDSLRQASAGLGARRVSTSLRVVLPAAASGVIAALVVGLSRAIGETMVVAVAAGAVGGSLFGLDLLSEGSTVTAAMASLGAGTDQVAGNDLAFQSLYFLGALLFITTFVLNLVGSRIVRRFQEKY
ncbi:MAG: phosphate ABC transporter permease subunit PstC [Acidimicrobiales bacterium]